MQEVDDWILAARARNGDQAAFTALVRRYERPIMHFCARMMGNAADAEDLAQECFLALHRINQCDNPKQYYEHWLSSVF